MFDCRGWGRGVLSSRRRMKPQWFLGLMVYLDSWHRLHSLLPGAQEKMVQRTREMSGYAGEVRESGSGERRGAGRHEA